MNKGTKVENLKKYIKTFVPNPVIEKYWQYRKYEANLNFEKSYNGNNEYCSFCKSKYKIFGTIGNPERENSRCFNCNFLERHRLVYSFLEKNTDTFIKKNIKLLHFALEKSFCNVFSKSSNIDYYPCDLSPNRFRYKCDVPIQKMDITDIPFDLDSFDVILCNHVFYK